MSSFFAFWTDPNNLNSTTIEGQRINGNFFVATVSTLKLKGILSLRDSLEPIFYFFGYGTSLCDDPLGHK
ncbi:hypothetical protein KW791_03060 [Candidatus Parcubacteria bacterium]|nr:hypothetical protein [Candidatus Parcubacteria bacterium]